MSPERPEERRLVSACVDGDPDAWRKLVSGYAPGARLKLIQVYLHRLGRPPAPQEQEELLQDLFVRLAKNEAASLRRFQWRCSLATYLSAVAGTCALERIRQDSRQRTRDRLRMDLDRAGEELSEEGESPLRGIETEELKRSLSAAMEELPSRDRLAIRMYFWEGMPPARIADALRTTPGYVWVVLQRSLQRLKARMKDGENRPGGQNAG